MKRLNSKFGCVRIVQEIAYDFAIAIDKDSVRRVLAKHIAQLTRDRMALTGWLSSAKVTGRLARRPPGSLARGGRGGVILKPRRFGASCRNTAGSSASDVPAAEILFPGFADELVDEFPCRNRRREG